MALLPDDHEWTGFTYEQAELLNRLDFYGNNDWSSGRSAIAGS